MSDESVFQGHVPTSFGRTCTVFDAEAQIERARRPTSLGTEPKKEENSDDDDDDDYSDEEDEFPVSHEMVLKAHQKAVTSISLDPAGARLATGSIDCTFKLHDFSAMTPTTIRAFRSVDPAEAKRTASTESHPVNQVLFNPAAPQMMLVLTATSQAKLFDRDGDLLCHTVNGDMYLRDLHNTKGHTAEITAGAWHPTDRNGFITSSADGTVRIWDVSDRPKQKDVIVFKSKLAGSAGRSRMTSVAWGATGSGIILSTALDGTMVMYDGKGPFSRPASEVRNAHQSGTWTSGLAVSPDGRLFASRGGDDTIKLWDSRKLVKPLASISHKSTSSAHPSSNILFSHSGSNILTGSETGDLHILNVSLRPELVTPVTPGSPLVTVNWHQKLNQIFTGSADGSVHALFNPSTSLKGAGALGVMGRPPKKRHVDDDLDLGQPGTSSDIVILPGGSSAAAAASFSRSKPNVGLTASGRSRDPRRPHMPAATPFSKSEPDSKHVQENVRTAAMLSEDPREALLKYAEEAKKNPVFTAAWKETQPTQIYDDLSDDEEPAAKKTKR